MLSVQAHFASFVAAGVVSAWLAKLSLHLCRFFRWVVSSDWTSFQFQFVPTIHG
jgi:hypothetical protein